MGIPLKWWHLRKENRWKPDFDELKALINNKTRIIYINHPHSPTGSVLSEEEVIDLTTENEENEEKNTPILSDPRAWKIGAVVSFDDVEKILAFNTEKVPVSKVGRNRPSGLIAFQARSASYVIDLNALRSPEDVRSDSLGAYSKYSTTSRY